MENLKPIINNITISANKRSTADIDNWRTALRSAENVQTPKRVLLYDLYAEIMLDPHLLAITEKRKLKITNTPLLFINENGIENLEIQKLIETDSFVELINYILESKFYGHSLIELSFNDGILQADLIPRKHVIPEKGIIVKNQSDPSGFNYREKPYTDHLIEVGEPNALGLLLAACPMALYKRNAYGDWSQYAEMFGSPYRIGKYDSYDEQTRLAMQTALAEMGNSSYIILPKTSEVEFIQNNGMATSGLYDALIKICDEQMSKLILGQTMTTQAETGGLAQAKVHQEEQKNINLADMNFVKTILNDKLVRLLKINGYECGNGKFIFRETEFIDKKTKLDMDLKIFKETGLEIDHSYWRQQYNLPEPLKQTKEGI